MTDWPKLEPLTPDEIVEKGDEMLDALANSELPTGLPTSLSDWVTAENARRAQAKAEFEAGDTEIGGVILHVGNAYNVTVTAGYSGSTVRRQLNCVFNGRRLSRSWRHGGRIETLSFTQYGKNPKGYSKVVSHTVMNIVAVEPVETPDWVAVEERKRAEWRAEEAKRLLRRVEDDE